MEGHVEITRTTTNQENNNQKQLWTWKTCRDWCLRKWLERWLDSHRGLYIDRQILEKDSG